MFFRRLILVAISWCAFSCDEFLPPREDPENVVDAILQIDSRIHVVRLDSNGIILPNGLTVASAHYIITNLYDEVLSDLESVFAEVEISIRDHPSYRRTLLADRRNLVGPVQVFSGTLTLEPGGPPAHIVVSWAHFLDLGIPDSTVGVWELPFIRFEEQIGPDSAKYLESERIWFSANASGRLWRNMPEKKAPGIQFWHIYRVYRQE